MDDKTLLLACQSRAREGLESTIRSALLLADTSIRMGREILAQALQDDHLVRLVMSEADSLDEKRASIPRRLYGLAEGRVRNWLNELTEQYLSTKDDLGDRERRKRRKQIQSSARLVMALLVKDTAELLNSIDWDDPYRQELMFNLGWYLSELDKRFPQGIMHHEIISDVFHSLKCAKGPMDRHAREREKNDKLLKPFLTWLEEQYSNGCRKFHNELVKCGLEMPEFKDLNEVVESKRISLRKTIYPEAAEIASPYKCVRGVHKKL